ncbi:MAG: di-heme oxidoredictase family protein [Planctomycetota bacterium]
MKRVFTIVNVLLVVGISVQVAQLAREDATGRQAASSHTFARGDANDDGRTDLSDAVFILGFLFLGGEAPPCQAAADPNDDGQIQITDAIYMLNFLFSGGPGPEAPYPLLGSDPTPDLPCRGPALPPLPEIGSLGGPDRDLDGSETNAWLRGREVFNRPFARSEGLGPIFNGDSCRGCHLDPVLGGAGGLDVDVVRFSMLDEQGQVVPAPGGPAASRMSVHGVAREEKPDEAMIIETRQTPSLFGLGLIDRLPDEVLLANADPDDMDGDGISGRARSVNDKVGRFGHKSGVPTLFDFAADAMLNELGVTVDPELSPFAANDDDDIPDPELATQDVQDLAFFMAHIAPPPRNIPDDEVVQATIAEGEQIFVQIGCAKCHLPSLEGNEGPVAAYSDFLLHDVADPARYFVEEGEIAPREFRTAPLWGIRDTAPYMHDGAAESIEDAVRQHFGEAAASRDAFEALGFLDLDRVMVFLESL